MMEWLRDLRGPYSVIAASAVGVVAFVGIMAVGSDCRPGVLEGAEDRQECDEYCESAGAYLVEITNTGQGTVVCVCAVLPDTIEWE